MSTRNPHRSDGDEPQQWHDGRRMVTLWVGRGQQWAESARDQAQRANRKPRNPLQRLALWLIGIPLGILAAASGLAFFIMAAAIGVVVVGFMIWMGMGVAGAAMAKQKGHSARFGWLLGLTLGPIGLLLIRKAL